MSNEKQKYTNHGSCHIEHANGMNVPVNIFITKENEGKPTQFWQLTAENFMPRKGYLIDGAYRITAKNKKTLVALVQKHVVPLYEAALHNLKTTGENYYWEIK